MKQFLGIIISVCLIFFCNNTIGQQVKVKSKPGKTKIKEVAATSTSKDSSSIITTTTSADHTSGLANTSWVIYISELSDSTIWSFTKDSTFAHSQSGNNLLVYGAYTLSHDTLSIHDVGGMYNCPIDQTGNYKITITDDWLTLALINDPCNNRAGVMEGSKWGRAKNYKLK